jgi:hypothetical protein
MSECGYPASGPEPSDQCKHRIIGIVPIVAVRVEGGTSSRCLLCGAVGPVMRNGEDSQRVLISGYPAQAADSVK